MIHIRKIQLSLALIFVPLGVLLSQEKKENFPVRLSKSVHNLSLKTPQNVVSGYKFLPELGKYMYTEKIGDTDISTPIFLTIEQYNKLIIKQKTRSYFTEKGKAISPNASGEEVEKLQRDLLPEFYVNSAFFETIFGGQNIDVIPQGSVAVDIGMRYNRSENPFISPEHRNNYTLDFDQQISLGLTGQVGTRLNVNALYDTQSTFDFQNIFKLEYTPNEDDILRKIEVGNVSLPLNSTLITGAQSLFGVKTELQFGRTTITGVFSSQRSESKKVTSQGGGTTQDFEIRILDYDENQHYFLSHFFRDNYDNALRNYPFIRSKVQITRVEVWATNRSNRTSNIRNIVALQDLGEAQAKNTRIKNNAPSGFFKGSVGNRPTNEANGFDPTRIGKGSILNDNIRDVATIKAGFGNLQNALNEGFDYSILENAQKLEEGRDYKVNRQLGYISLSSRLNNDEILAVAYQYTYEGNVYQVGEFANDGISATSYANDNNAITNNTLVLKMLKSNRVNTGDPIWDLMMKNIYSIGALQINPENFRMNIFYTDPSPINYISAADPTTWNNDLTKKVLLQLFHLDRLNSYNDPQNGGDGFFDFVEGITIDSQFGKIIFPSVEPFGKYLYNLLGGGTDYDNPQSYNPNQKKYVYHSLYKDLKSKAQEESEKNKFLLKGKYKSQSGRGISLGTFNVPKGSVRVRVGGRLLQEGIDYTVNYQTGMVQILDPSIENSNIPVEVSVENNLIFGGQDRRFIGVNVNHKFSDKFNIGASVINMRERPFTQKANYGQEPVNNTIIGFGGSFSTEMPFLTRWLNEIPRLRSEVASNISVRGEMAYLLPSSPKSTNFDGEATSYLDDFEATQTTIDIRNVRSWALASTPLAFVPNQQLHGSTPDDAENLKNGYGRSKLAWYTIDPIFYSTNRPDGISADEISKNSTRRIYIDEIFPEQEVARGESLVQYTLDLAYYPQKKGPYNNNPSAMNALHSNEKWGGIMRGISTTNFEDNNIEYIQFWLLDPYSSDEFQPSSGELVFDLGNISEDILKDGRKQYENGLPGVSIQSGVNKTAWGSVPITQSLVYAFDNNEENRTLQDVGFDGLNDQQEAQIYTNNLGESPNDPALDNYQYYLNREGGILNRYLHYNGTQGNSPSAISDSNRGGSTTPDVEDVNKDNTMSTVNSYYEYRVPIKSQITRNDKYVSDIREVSVEAPNGKQIRTRWIQFKIPVKSTDRKNFGGGGDLRSVTHLRMYLTGFTNDVVLRFGTLDLVWGDWRNYTKTLSADLDDPSDDDTQVQISSVNIQENETRQPIPYRMPPGVYREQINQNNTLVQQNEQSLSFAVCNLESSDMRGVYKNINADLRQYKRIKMFLHAEAFKNEPLSNGDLVAFIRLGSDFTENFYQVEIPLEVTPQGASSEDLIWTKNNMLDISMEILTQLKARGINNNSLANISYYDAELNPINQPETTPYTIGKNRYAVKGNPSLGNVRSLMIGVKNATTNRICGEVWFNELRLAELENKGGWAAIGEVDMNAADFMNMSVSGRISTAGFGDVEQKPNERSREEIKQLNAVMNINAGKLLPKKWNVQIPVGLNMLQHTSTPEYDPYYDDIKLKDRLNSLEGKQKEAVKQQAQTHTIQQGITLIGVKKNLSEGQKQKFYNIENVTFNYVYNQMKHHDFEIDTQKEQNLRTGVSYAYSFKPMSVEPLKKVKFFSGSRYWQWLSQINLNLLPSSINFSSNISRSFRSQRFREVYTQDIDPDLQTGLPELQQRNYLFDWKYGINHNLTKSLKIGFDVSNNNIVRNYFTTDSKGQKVLNKSLSIWDDFWNFGEPNHYTSEFRLNYELPLDKLPYLSFIKSSYSYNGTFDWQRGSQELLEISGENINTIQNANTHNLTSNISLESFYRSLGIRSVSKQSGLKDYALNILAMVKRIGITYSQTNATLLPGYLNSSEFLTTNPSIGFVLGSQADIRYQAARKGWISSFDDLNAQFIQSENSNLGFIASLQPLPDLQIELNADRQYTDNYSETFSVQNNEYQKLIGNRVGNFSISDNMILTAFAKSDAYHSQTFEQFKENRKIIANRLAISKGININNPDNLDNEGYPKGFGKNNQAVLMPAFYAAYTGRNPEEISFETFRKIPIPNWNLRYSGLMRMESFRRLFRRFSLTHGYRSSLSLNDFRSNLEYKPTENSLDQGGNFRNEFLFTNVNLIEQFSPLIRVDLEMKNTLSILAEIRKERTISISLDNNYLTEIALKEYRLGLGYRFKDLRFATKIAGENVILKSDLNLKADISLRDNFTVIRNMEISDNRVTSGQTSWQTRFTADYALSKHLTALYYFDYSFSKHAISTAYPQTTLRTGITLRYTF